MPVVGSNKELEATGDSLSSKATAEPAGKSATTVPPKKIPLFFDDEEEDDEEDDDELFGVSWATGSSTYAAQPATNAAAQPTAKPATQAISFLFEDEEEENEPSCLSCTPSEPTNSSLSSGSNPVVDSAAQLAIKSATNGPCKSVVSLFAEEDDDEAWWLAASDKPLAASVQTADEPPVSFDEPPSAFHALRVATKTRANIPVSSN